MGIIGKAPAAVAGVLACLAPCLEWNSYVFNAFGHSLNTVVRQYPNTDRVCMILLRYKQKKRRYCI